MVAPKKVAVKDAPEKHWVEFRNIENVGHDLNFDRDGAKYRLQDGKKLLLTQDMIDYINDLSTPDYKFIPNPEIPGAVISKVVGRIYRFNCAHTTAPVKKGRPFSNVEPKPELVPA